MDRPSGNKTASSVAHIGVASGGGPGPNVAMPACTTALIISIGMTMSVWLPPPSVPQAVTYTGVELDVS